jgi:hypothetical protein
LSPESIRAVSRRTSARRSSAASSTSRSDACTLWKKGEICQ